VGQKLLSAAVAARDLISAPGRWCVITGPNLDAASFDSLASKGSGEIDVFRFRSDFRQLLGSAELSISQAGYNTVCDVLRAGCGSLLVPFAAGGETEQTARAVKLRELGLAEFIEEAAITPDLVASGIGKALAQRGKARLDLNMDGARETARLLRREINHEN
jgi:predicted glycosyltransferase